MQLLKANTAIDVLLGPFVSTTDGYTPITTGTITVELSKNGQALATKSDVTTPTHDAAGTIDGYWNCELDLTDTNTEGCLTLVAYVSTALPVKHEYMVLSEAAYDSFFAAKDTGFMDVNVEAVQDTTQTAGDLQALITTVDTVVDTINTNVGTAGAGLTNIGTIATVTNLTNLPTIPTDWLTAAGTAADFGTEVAAATLAAQVESVGAVSLQEAMSIILAYAAGVTSGQDTASPVFNAPNSATSRITGTTDGSGNRTATAITPSS